MAVDFYAGCLGGCAGVLVGHPFDTVKGLYKGMSSPMAGLAAVNAIVFGVYGNILRSSSSPNSLQSQFLAGSAAGLVQSFVTSPMEFAKTRMQLQGQANPDVKLPFWQRNRIRYKNPLDCLLKTFRHEGGLPGVYRGLGCTVLRDAPAFGVYFAGYEYLTRKATDSRGKVSTLNLLLAGGLAGVLSWVVIYPLDVMKSRLQADGMDGGTKKYEGLWDCAKKSYRREGLGVFTRGLNSTIIRAFPTNAATFAVVTWVLMFCDSPVRAQISVETPKSVLMLDKDIQTLAC